MDEKKSEEATPKPPEWEYKTSFGINERMKEVIHLTVDATESELVVLRRKLNKLTYGS